jgi:AcrR family transcriptional regulator
MTGRPRKVSDDQLFAAAYAVMNRVGPGEFTLAAIAEEAGVTAAVLVQRFGSKRALLLTLAQKHAEGSSQFFHSLEERHKSPLAALRAYADCMASLATSPAAFARSLAYLQIDLSDEEFRVHLAAQARATRTALKRWIESAIRQGELLPLAKPAQLARTVDTIVSGSLLQWAFYQEGAAAKWLRQDLEAVLAPYLPKE